jgi:ribosomal protein L37AE/L43A
MQEWGYPVADGQPLCRDCGCPMVRHKRDSFWGCPVCGLVAGFFKVEAA